MSECLTSIDLFCGAGGLTLGLARAGFQTALALDNWEPALRTLETNFPDVAVLGSDVRDVSGSDLLAKAGLDKAPAAVVGGPPCQGFTSAGARRASDARNTLIAEFARLAVEMRPKLVLFENVEGFLTLDKGSFVVDLLDPLVGAGYHVQLKKVNVANYGVPQLRKRVVGIGMLGCDPGFPNFTHRAFGAPGAQRYDARHLPSAPTVLEAIAHLPQPSSDAPGDVPDHHVRSIGRQEMDRMRFLAPGQTMRDLPEHLRHDSYNRRANRRVGDGTPTERRGGAPAGLRRLRGDQPSKAVTSAASREFVHPTEDRPLTLRECAAIQTFPDSFQFAGSATDRATLIGNAIPPVFARVLGEHLRSVAALHVEEPHEDGRVVSFEPTAATGMSPALQRVTARVANRYGLGRMRLWD